MKKNTTESKLTKAANQQMAEPPAFVWENIEEELHPQDSKRKFAFWWFGSALMAIIFIVLFVNIDQDKNRTTTDIATSNTTVHQKNTIQNNQTTLLSSNKRTTKDLDLNDKLTSDDVTSDDITIEKSIGSTQSNRNNNSIEKINKGNALIATLTTEYPDYLNSTTSNNTNSSRNEKRLIAVHANNSVISKSNKEDRSNISTHAITSLSTNFLIYDRADISYNECPKFNKKLEFKPFVEFGVLGGVHNIGLSQNNNIHLYNLRKNSESSWYSTGLYTNIGLNISKNWHASIGAEWTMSKDRFESKIEGITKMIVTFDPANGTAIDTSFISGALYNKGDITFHFIDIPMSLGYTISKDKWKYGIELTGLLNIKTFSEGKIYNDSEGITSIESEDNIYKSSIGLGLKSSIVIARELNDDFTLQVKPTFKTYLNTINNENYSLPTKYKLFSISIGLKKYF